jgi:glutamate synthase (NADPH/NADH) large chain
LLTLSKNKQALFDKLEEIGIYDPKFEHDNCGFGLVTQVDDIASHELVKKSIVALGRLTHRGAVSADGKSGDGCGLLCKMPKPFFKQVCQQENIDLQENFATGIVFLNPEQDDLAMVQQQFAYFAQTYQMDIAGWRKVPTQDAELGSQALSNKPNIYQVFINLPAERDVETLETQLFIVRRKVEKALQNTPHFYIVSLSSRVIGYKALAIPESLAKFYLDLNNPDFASSLCVFHQRFSTNTLPQWRLAQPFRYLAHNGEINTLRGNLNGALSREKQFTNEHIDTIDEILPLIDTTGSDSQSLDNMLEALIRLGNLPLYEAIRILIPPAWQNMQNMDVNLRAFYQYHALHMEPWDGPAGIVMTDGRYAVCSLDRNGLRPARWLMTEDRHVIVASEMGIYDCPNKDIIAKGRVGAGEILVIDTEEHEMLFSKDVDKLLMNENPYRQWLADHFIVIKSNLDDQRFLSSPVNDDEIERYKKMFNITNEEQQRVLNVLAKTGKEAIGSMGDDTPLAILSARIRPLYDYFRQQFAQVTNPPIDPLREKSVMSLETHFGREQDCFYDEETNVHSAMVMSPVLSVSKYRSILSLNKDDFPSCFIDLNYTTDTAWQEALHDIADRVVQAVTSGSVIVVLSDKHIRDGYIPVHALLATGIVHQRLLQAGLRCQANIIVETATVRDPHHFAVLLGFGATAIYPYLAYACIHHSFTQDNDSKLALYTIRKKFRLGINLGLYKILSKMGISCISSYRGAQLFEIIGLNQEIVELCFPKTTSRLAGVNFATLQQEQLQLGQEAGNTAIPVAPGGRYQYRYNNEQHAFNPDVVTHLIKAATSGDSNDYQDFAKLVNERPAMEIETKQSGDSSQCLSTKGLKQ